MCIRDRLKIDHAVEFIDWIDRKDLDQYFINASAFLFPSHEGAGMVVPEALSFGIPVICLDNIGPGESVDQHCGLKVSNKKYGKTIRELSIHLNALHNMPRFKYSLSVGAENRFYDYFTWKRKGKVISKIYKKLLPQEQKQLLC